METEYGLFSQHDSPHPQPAHRPDDDANKGQIRQANEARILAAAKCVFANELLHGAPVVKQLLATQLRTLVQTKAEVIALWVTQGRMAPVDPMHLFFTLWAATQTYADFEVPVCAVLGQADFTHADQARATEHVVSLLLRGCGL